jgi:hypothetical protein
MMVIFARPMRKLTVSARRILAEICIGVSQLSRLAKFGGTNGKTANLSANNSDLQQKRVTCGTHQRVFTKQPGATVYLYA